MTTRPLQSSVTLQRFDASHLQLLAGWLKQPHVAPWYPEPDENLFWAANPPIGASQAIIAAGSSAVGYLRWQRVARETLDALGLPEIPANSVDADILIGDIASVGNGWGVDALKALANEVRRDPTVPLIGLTTSVANTHAHRAFERAGFRIARQYDPNGLGQCHLMLLDLRR